MTGGGFLLLLAINWHAPDYQISRKWKRDVSFIIEIEKIKLYSILFESTEKVNLKYFGCNSFDVMNDLKMKKIK